MHLTLHWSSTPAKFLTFAGLEPQLVFCASYVKSHGPFLGKDIKLITCYSCLSLCLICKDCSFET